MKLLQPRSNIQVHNTQSYTSRCHPTTFTSVNILKTWHISWNNTPEPTSNRQLHILRICYKPQTWNEPCACASIISVKKSNGRRAVTTEDRFQFQTDTCEICGAQIVILFDYFVSSLVSITPPMLHTYSFVIDVMSHNLRYWQMTIIKVSKT
jgi:hypothetical protein